MARSVHALSIVLASGCYGPDIFACTDDAQCGQNGRCESAGYCSFPDSTCPSGRRFDQLASPAFASTCVTQGTIQRGSAVTTFQSDEMTASASVSVMPGSLILAIPYWDDSLQAVTVTDTLNNTWVAKSLESIPDGCYNTYGSNVQIFYAISSGVGTTTITATQAQAGMAFGMFVARYEGVAAMNPEDGSIGMTAPTSSSEMTAGELTTTGYDLIVAGFHDSKGLGMMTAETPLTAVVTDTDAIALYADAMVPADHYALSAMLPASDSNPCWVAAAIAFRAQ